MFREHLHLRAGSTTRLWRTLWELGAPSGSDFGEEKHGSFERRHGRSDSSRELIDASTEERIGVQRIFPPRGARSDWPLAARQRQERPRKATYISASKPSITTIYIYIVVELSIQEDHFSTDPVE